MTRQRMARGPMPINGPVSLGKAVQPFPGKYAIPPEIQAWNEAVDRRKAATKGKK